MCEGHDVVDQGGRADAAEFTDWMVAALAVACLEPLGVVVMRVGIEVVLLPGGWWL